MADQENLELLDDEELKLRQSQNQSKFFDNLLSACL